MFGFNKKNDNNDNDNFYRTYDKSRKEYYDWVASEEYKQFQHLQTLIIKMYEMVNIKADLLGIRIDESFTRSDFIEDFKMFFKPEVFNKLKRVVQ